MEFFEKAKAVRFRTHLDKYLVANEDEETVQQSRNGSSRKARWTVEYVEGNTHLVRLKSIHGRYLTASDVPFLFGMTGKMVLQTMPAAKLDSSVEWEPIREGFQVKLRTRGGKFLRANGGTPPWRNSITHDMPYRSATQDWILWDVDVVDIPEYESFDDNRSPLSSFSSISDDLLGSELASPMSIISFKSPRVSKPQLGMELFRNAKAVRLRSHHGKYLLAQEDDESVSQDRNGSSRNARWTVEFVEGGTLIRLKSCHGRYLTASNVPFLLGMTGKKVLHTIPARLDSSVEWEPVRDGFQVKLKTRYGKFLRANGGLPPWRNSVTHDIPHRTATQDWVLWDVDIVEIQIGSPSSQSSSQSISPFDSMVSEPNSPSSFSIKSPKLSRFQSIVSFISSQSSKVDGHGRIIYYNVADENGNIDDAVEGASFTFRRNGVDELTHKLEEETGLEDIIVCSHNPLNGELYPLRLQLPPNNTTMHVVVVQSSSRGEILPFLNPLIPGVSYVLYFRFVLLFSKNYFGMLRCMLYDRCGKRFCNTRESHNEMSRVDITTVYNTNAYPLPTFSVYSASGLLICLQKHFGISCNGCGS
ncbi:hypothetical protein HHK36_015259 [Tetracentron sinense]|uniref:DUF569 domain-containing protein n=1 Tax=Tetracentron sinense TaxID=13715 RepID=A0A834Z2R0_TETSI|nr:hypothetical protein HHK36_015259 [Tetracentron sinense]